MKKLKYIILMSCLLMLSGCIKNYNTMTIKNDKSMTFESEILIADDLKEGMTEAFDRESYENAGFTISEAKIEGYSGYKFTKKYDNIDKYSNGDGATFVISDILEGKIDDKVMFKLEKGFLKNTYTATFKYSVDTDEYTNDNTIDIDESENDTANTDSSNNNDSTNTDINDEDVNVEETDTDEENINDLISLANEMEFNYKLILPSKAISNNATKVSDDGKTLTWDLIAGESDINFSFSLLNITNILILGGSIVAIIILIIVVIIIIKNKKSQKDTLIHTDYDPSIMNNVNNMNNMNNMNTQNSIQNQNLTPNPMTTPQIDNQNTMLQQNPDVQGPLPSNNSLEIVLPSEETQKQVNIVQKQAMFVTKNNEYVEEVKEVPHNETVVEVPNAIELNDNKNLQN